MFEINKEKFGLFVAELRKGKNLTQKELARRLFLSDKAVSKWETGNSLPDTALLIPLADLLGVSVTELLMCERIPRNDTLETDQAEEIVKTANTYADENPERAYQTKSKWIAFYGLSFFMGCIGIFLNYLTGKPCSETLTTIVLLCAGFGAYFCCFVKTKLPVFYDENKVNIFYDGPFRMHMPGLRFNNSNWPHIIKISRICMCLFMILFPIVNLIMSNTAWDLWAAAENFIFLAVFLCGIFFPVYLVGKKYE